MRISNAASVDRQDHAKLKYLRAVSWQTRRHQLQRPVRARERDHREPMARYAVGLSFS